MRRIVTTVEMRALENTTKEEFGFSSELIQENVARSGAREIAKYYAENNGHGEILFFVGPGNNGADGLAIARQLTLRHYKVRAFLLSKAEEACELVKIQARLARNFGVKMNPITSKEELEDFLLQSSSNLAVDAILGTGIHAPLSHYLYEQISLIRMMHQKKRFSMVAIDLPSGIDGDSGEVIGTVVPADLTLAVGAMKLGCYTSEGAKHVGKVKILEAGIPEKLLMEGDKFVLTEDTFLPRETSRNKFADKKDFGHTLVIGGSHGLTGALVLSSNAAMKVGAGLVTAATWEPQYKEMIMRQTPEVMTGYIPMDTTKWTRLIKDIGKYAAIVIGPGLARSTRTRKLVIEILNNYQGPVVIDADAINVMALDQDSEIFRLRNAPTLLTPHYGEFARFIGKDFEVVQSNPVNELKKVIDKINCSVILKGPCTYLGYPTGQVYFNFLPNDGMATGGVGDVLAGMLGGLLGQEQTIADSNQSLTSRYESLYHTVNYGVYMHAIAGKIASKKYGERSMTAMNLIDALPKAFDSALKPKVS